MAHGTQLFPRRRTKTVDTGAGWGLPTAIPCEDTSVASVQNKAFYLDAEQKPLEDRYTVIVNEGIKLYIVMDGHDSARAADFALKCLPDYLLASDLQGPPDSVRSALVEAFVRTDTLFFKDMDPHLTQRAVIRADLEEYTSAEAQNNYPRHVEKLQEIEEAIRGGTTVALALIVGDSLYVANVGNTRVLLCTLDEMCVMKVSQMSVDHVVANEDELTRLVDLGLDRTCLLRSERLGMHQNTRSIGDYFVKHGYQDVDTLRVAKGYPGTAEPSVSGPVPLQGIKKGFIVLVSKGLYSGVTRVVGGEEDARLALVRMIMEEMKRSSSLADVSRTVIDRVHGVIKAKYKESHGTKMDCSSVDDTTLLIRNLGFPIGHSDVTPTSLVLVEPVSVPQTKEAVQPAPPEVVIDSVPADPSPSSLSHSKPDTEEVLSDGDSDYEFDSDDEVDVDSGGFDPHEAELGVKAYVNFDMLNPSMDYDAI